LNLPHSDEHTHPLTPHYFKLGDFTVLTSWNSLLEQCSALSAEKVSGCNQGNSFRVYECPEGHYRKIRPFSSCRDHFCLRCAGNQGRKLGHRAFKRLIAVSSYYGYYVFTVPSRLWNLFYDSEMIERWRKVCRKTLAKFYGCVIGGVDREHVWGDKKLDHMSRGNTHINVLMPLIGFFGAKKSKAKILRFYHSKADLKRLNRLYCLYMNREFNLQFKRVNVFYEFISRDDRVKLLHVCSYMMRPPLEVPLRDSVVPLGGYSKRKLSSFLKAVYRHFNYYAGHRSVRWFGWMSHHVFKAYLGRMHFSDEEIEHIYESLQYEPDKCPICGAILKLVAWYSDNVLVLDRPPPTPFYDVKASSFGLSRSERFFDARHHVDSIAVRRRNRPDPELVPHTFEDLKKANPTMPDHMIRWFLAGGFINCLGVM
jgi:hypothetical protein